jgi:putative transposase
MVPFFINDILNLSGRRYRLLKLVECRLLPEIQAQRARQEQLGKPEVEGQAGAYVIEMNAAKPVPEFWLAMKLRTALGESACNTSPEDLDADTGRPQIDSPEDIAVRDLRWSRITDLVNDDRIWEPATRGPLLREHAENIGTTRETLLATLRKWWQGGQVKDALLGRLFNCGHIELEKQGGDVFKAKSERGEEVIVFRPPTQASRGPNRKDGKRPFAFAPKLRKLILRVAQRQFLTDYAKSVSSAASKVLAHIFCERDAAGKPLKGDDGKVVLKPPAQRPSKAQVRYLLKKCIPVSAAYAARHGRHEYENNKKPRPGSIMDDCLGAGDVFEIDSTKADIWLVARANRAAVFKRKPTLYLVVDRGSRLIVGFHVTLENASWAEGAQAILSIAGNWKKLCERFGVPYRKEDWPAWARLPNRFVSDRGDMIAEASEQLTDAAGVPITNAPPLSPPSKSPVETCMRLAQLPFRRYVPGHEPSENYRKRRAKKYGKDACLNMHEFAGLMLHSVWKHNTSVLTGYTGTAEEILSDLPFTPVNLWHMQQAKQGLGRRMQIDVLRRKLLPQGVGTMKYDGLHFRDCIYYSEEVREWMVIARTAGVFDVKVSYTSNLVNTVIVYDPADTRRSFVLPLGPKSLKYRNYTFLEVENLRSRERDRAREGKEANEAGEATFILAAEEVTEPAYKEAREASADMPLGKRVTVGEAERQREAHERRSDHHDLSRPLDPYGAAAAAPATQAQTAETAISGEHEKATAETRAQQTVAPSFSPMAPQAQAALDRLLAGDLENV